MEFSDLYTEQEKLVLFAFYHSPQLQTTYNTLEHYLQKNLKSVIEAADLADDFAELPCINEETFETFCAAVCLKHEEQLVPDPQCGIACDLAYKNISIRSIGGPGGLEYNVRLGSEKKRRKIRSLSPTL